MKLGLCLVGISHLIHTQRWPTSRSYLKNKDGFTESLYKPLLQNFNVKTYFTTYVSSEAGNIIEFYKPEACQFLNFKNSHQIKTFIKSIELIEEEDLDFVLFTRFDLCFNKEEMKKLNFNLTKFNFLCKEKDWWETYKFTNDCFYFLPKAFLPELKKACIELYMYPPRPGLMDMHGLYNKLTNHVSADKINFMTDEHHTSSATKLYDVLRVHN